MQLAKKLFGFAVIIAVIGFSIMSCDDGSGKETTPPAHIHQWHWVTTTAATTEATGLETKTCSTCGATDGTRIIDKLPFTSVDELGTWLTSQPANDTDTPYIIKMNITNTDDFATLKTTLNNAADKYVYLDLSGSTITEIPSLAFNTGVSDYKGCATLTGITIPDSVQSIGIGAFFDCANLASVTIGNGVQSIGGGAFSDCLSLISITIPDRVTSIGEQAFDFCRNLTSVTIGSGVTSIADNAFWSCISLTAITVDTANTAYSSENGVLYNKNKTTLVKYPEKKADTTFSIPDSVTSIGNNAFTTCTVITNVAIPGGLQNFGDYAFYNCPNLASVTIPVSVTSIGRFAFRSCTSLASVTFEGTISSEMFSSFNSFNGDLRDKFYATDADNGTPGTYTTTVPVYYPENAVWTKQP